MSKNGVTKEDVLFVGEVAHIHHDLSAARGLGTFDDEQELENVMTLHKIACYVLHEGADNVMLGYAGLMADRKGALKLYLASQVEMLEGRLQMHLGVLDRELQSVQEGKKFDGTEVVSIFSHGATASSEDIEYLENETNIAEMFAEILGRMRVSFDLPVVEVTRDAEISWLEDEDNLKRSPVVVEREPTDEKRADNVLEFKR